MDYIDVYNQLLDVPYTFRRTGYVYTALISAMAAGLSRTTRAVDMLSPNSVTLATAKWGWLDTIGKLFNVIRNQLEIDSNYRNRILATLSAPHGTPLAIASFIQVATGLMATVTEDFATTSYQINFEVPISDLQLEQVIVAINWVRPAGVPFLPLFRVSGGLYLATLNYLGVQLVTGSYLTKTILSITVQIGINTNNPVSTLPTVYLIDPFILGTIQPAI